MKFLLKIILVLFLFVQIAPTLICLIDNEKRISINIADEDENSKEEKEFKIAFTFNDNEWFYFLNSGISKKIPNDYLIKDYKIFPSVTIIPPKV